MPELPRSDAFLRGVASSSERASDAFAEWLKVAAVPVSWRGARVQSGALPVHAADEGEADSDAEADDSEDAAVVGALSLEDCAVGDWVEVESGKKLAWYGQVAVLRPDSAQPLAVRWLGPSAQPKPGALSPLQHTWTWRGGAHFIELAAVRQVSRTMFHPLRSLVAQARPNKELFCSAVFCVCDGVSGVRRGSGGKGAGLQPSAARGPALADHQTPPLLTWEPGVTADVASDLLPAAPFVYSCDRLYNLTGQPGGFVVEERLTLGRCFCKGRAHGIHCAAGECASELINRGGVPRRLCVKPSGNGRGHGVFAAEDILAKQYVAEYVGEVIRRDEAKRREKNYASLGMYYLHDVKGAKELGGEDGFTIDPTHYGNLGRCLNHNCVPNLTTCEIPVARAPGDGQSMPRVPRVGFFALRDISAGEELSIDYSPGRSGDQLKKVLRCRCDAGAACKGWCF